jgi:hypothetical protein
MRDYREEPNRVFGIPVRPPGSSGPEGEARQRVLGFPVDWFGGVGTDALAWFTHPVREYQRRARRRRQGPGAADQDAPSP